MADNKKLSYSSITNIKLHEFFWFYKEMPDYYCYINHLNEITWLSESEAEKQHEYYLLDPEEEKLIIGYIGGKPGSLDQYEGDERGVRRVLRRYLVQKHNLPLTSDLEPGNDEIITEQQVEKINIFYQPDLYKKKVIRKPLIVVGLILVLMAIMWFLSSRKTGGQILVNTGGNIAEVYLDSLPIGHSNQILKGLPYGQHLLWVKKKGFVAKPLKQKIMITKDSVIKVDISLTKTSDVKYGYLSLKTNVREAQLYIDEEYWGNSKDYAVIKLISGKHKIALKKPFYISNPEFLWVNILPGDTIQAPIEMKLPAAKNTASFELQSQTYVEVSSNVPGATILLNKQKTPFTTDHVFTDLKMGNYIIELQKNGYRFSPEYINVNLSKQNLSAKVRFEGEILYNQAMISVTPEDAVIVIDGKIQGKGSFQDKLRLGKHTLDIIPPEGYAPYASYEFTVTSMLPYSKDIVLLPYFTYGLYIDSHGNLKKENCSVITGYYEKNRGFLYTTSAGPELLYCEQLNDYVWKFGYAFPYKTPPGNDALQIKFTFNENLNLLSHAKLIIYAAASNEKYPKTFTEQVAWRVTINNYKLHDILQISDKPQNGELLKYEWDVTKQLKYGRNILEISTTDENNMFFFIKDIILTNQQ